MRSEKQARYRLSQLMATQSSPQNPSSLFIHSRNESPSQSPLKNKDESRFYLKAARMPTLHRKASIPRKA